MASPDMEKSRPSIGIAKWGAACASCSAAKSKCIRSNDAPGAKCDRCHSLQKECLEQVHKPRKKRQRKNAIPRLDKTLVSHCGLPENYVTASKTVVSPRLNDQIQSREQSRFPHRLLQSYNSLRAKSCACNGSYTEDDAVPQESDDVLFAIYINQICDGFPFVAFPQGTKPSHLNTSRPFLLQVIRMASSIRNSRSMKGQCCAILRHLSEAVYVNHERSLDLLQGLLVLLASYHNLCLVHHEFNSLVQLATAILGDLGLNRSPILPHWAKFAMREPEEPRARTNEERRITAGVWYMSSNASMAFSKVDSPRYTKYIDECLQKLQEAQEYESDELLVALVRIQQLTERIHHLSLKNQMVDDLPGVPSFPASVYFPILQIEVERLWGALPGKLKSNYVLVTHFDTARLRLYEVALTDKSFIYGLSAPLDQLTPSTAPALDIVHRAHMALTKWVDNWLSIPVCYYFSMPQPLFTMLFYGITMLCRWMKSFQAQPQSSEGTTPASISTINTAAAANIASLPDLASATDGSNQVSKSSGLRTAVKNNLKVYVQSRPDLQIDVLAILTTMVRRYKSARPEIQAAHGGVWENGTYDLAACKLEVTRDRLQWWCNITPSTSDEVTLLLRSASGEQTLAADGVEDTEDQIIQDPSKEWNDMETGDLLSDPKQGAFQWMNGLDGMSLDGSLFFDDPGDWSNIFTFDEGQF